MSGAWPHWQSVGRSGNSTTTELRLTSHNVRRASAALGGMPSGTTVEANSPSARQRIVRRPNAQPTNTSSRRARCPPVAAAS